MRIRTLSILAVFLGLAALGGAQDIVQARGVDARVDYAQLATLGVWDDRNYELTAEDLEFLAENESELNVRIPVFFRIELRKELPKMLRSGPVQYPLSAYPKFINRYGGYLINGRLYRRVLEVNGRFQPDLSHPWSKPKAAADRGLTSDVRVSSPNGAAESAVAINPANSNIVIAGSNGPVDPQTMFYSSDGGSSWHTAASLPLGDVCCDPTVAWSSDGSKAYAASLRNSGSTQVLVYRSGDNGQTWTDLENETGADPRRELGSGTDKEYLHVDVSSSSPCLDDVYLTWHEGNTMIFSRSTDRANTWSTPVSLSTTSQYGIGSDITSDKAGNIYYFWPTWSSDEILVRKSTAPSCGAAFDPAVSVASTQASYDFPLPSMDFRRAFVYVSAASDLSSGPYAGSVYAAWTDSTGPTGSTPADNHGRIQVAYSRDAGATWNVSTPHETADANTVDRYHPWLAVGPEGTVHVIYFDTRNDATRTSVDIYWSHSSSGGQTWSTPERLTTEISPSIDDGFEFGDYNGLDVVMTNLIAIFTDNRNESGGSSDSVDIYAAGRVLAYSEIFSDGFESGSLSQWSSIGSFALGMIPPP